MGQACSARRGIDTPQQYCAQCIVQIRTAAPRGGWRALPLLVRELELVAVLETRLNIKQRKNNKKMDVEGRDFVCT
jgi:hypothetical protein